MWAIESIWDEWTTKRQPPPTSYSQVTLEKKGPFMCGGKRQRCGREVKLELGPLIHSVLFILVRFRYLLILAISSTISLQGPTDVPCLYVPSYLHPSVSLSVFLRLWFLHWHGKKNRPLCLANACLLSKLPIRLLGSYSQAKKCVPRVTHINIRSALQEVASRPLAGSLLGSLVMMV